MVGSEGIHVVALGGGAGTRFWPASRRAMPKQLLTLGGAETLLQATFARVRSLVPPERWWLVAGAGHAEACLAAVPELEKHRLLAEPIGRNTAPAVTVAALAVRHVDAGAILVVLPADHHVTDAASFVAAIDRAAALAEKGPIVTLGIEPTYAETGFGYIERGEPDARCGGAFRVSRFHEKPDFATANEYLDRGTTYWNAGIFVMRADVLLSEVERQLPDLSECLGRVGPALGTAEQEASLAAAYAQIEAISIDHGVMEGASDLAVLPVDCGWSDIGSWRALGARIAPDAEGNVSYGRTVAIGTKDCVLYAGRNHVVAAVDVEGLVVVHTPDATLVLPAERAQRVREVIAEIEKRGWTEFE